MAPASLEGHLPNAWITALAVPRTAGVGDDKASIGSGGADANCDVAAGSDAGHCTTLAAGRGRRN